MLTSWVFKLLNLQNISWWAQTIIKKARTQPKYFSPQLEMGALTKCLSPSTKCCGWGWMCWTPKKEKMRLMPMWSPKLSGSCENKSKMHATSSLLALALALQPPTRMQENTTSCREPDAINEETAFVILSALISAEDRNAICLLACLPLLSTQFHAR